MRHYKSPHHLVKNVQWRRTEGLTYLRADVWLQGQTCGQSSRFLSSLAVLGIDLRLLHITGHLLSPLALHCPVRGQREGGAATGACQEEERKL